MPSLKEYDAKLNRLRSACEMTRTMKMVSANKLRRAMAARRQVAEYWDLLRDYWRRCGNRGAAGPHPLLAERSPVRRVRVLVVASDRGLCGGFNNSLGRNVAHWIAQRRPACGRLDVEFCGQRGFTFFKARGEAGRRYGEVAGRAAFAPVRRLAAHLQAAFLDGRFDELHVAYNAFRGVLSQVPVVERVLPFTVPADGTDAARDDGEWLLEPAGSAVRDAMIPQLVRLKLYAIFMDSAIGEHAARMTAMENATLNAERLIESNTLLRNRARQATITRELIEILSGAEALK